MSIPYFKFKRFTVFHDESAMKVGTDGTLIGAWASLEGVKTVLDVGCGCGLIALMIAQRSSDSTVLGIDIDEASVRQAARNVAASLWADRVSIECRDVRDLKLDDFGRFDLVVTNPPFYEEDVACPDLSRNSARHTDCLSFEELVEAAARLLSEKGTLSLVLPAKSKSRFVGVAASRWLYLSRFTSVITKPGKQPKRVLMEFKRTLTDAVEDDLYIYNKGIYNKGMFSEEYVKLMKDFYLNL